MQWIKDALGWFRDVFQTAFNFFLEIPAKIWELICKAGQLLFDFFFHEEFGLLWWFVRKLLEWGQSMIEQFPDLSAVLVNYQAELQTVMFHVSGLNEFFPIAESAVLLTTFLGFIATFLCVKILCTVLVRGG